MELEELKEQNAALRHAMEDMTSENMSLQLELEELKLQLLEVSNKGTQQPKDQQKRQKPKFTPTMPNKYSVDGYFTTEERRGIKFEMTAGRVRGLESDEETDFRFYGFQRAGEEDVRKPEKFDGLTDTDLGTFQTPLDGKYRFDVKGAGGRSCRSDWYLCCVAKEDDIFGDGDKGNNSDNSDDENEEAMMEKLRVMKEKTHRQLLFTLDPSKGEDVMLEASVGVECQKDMLVWVEMVVRDGRCNQRECVVMFSGRLVC